MATNIGVLDRVFRLVFGGLMLAWSYEIVGAELSVISDWLVWVIGTAFTLTGIFRHCPLYAYFNTDSCAPYPTRADL